VRDSVNEWKKETQNNYMSALEKATLNRCDAEETRRNAIGGQVLLSENRRQDASAIRTGIKQVSSRLARMPRSRAHQSGSWPHDKPLNTPPCPTTVRASSRPHEAVRSIHQTREARRGLRGRVRRRRPGDRRRAQRLGLGCEHAP
jgi:hypothetical protein